MSKPIPGNTYIIQVGDTLKRIAQRAYGNARTDLISTANQSISATDISEILPPGINIIIPKIPEDEAIKTNLVKTSLPNQQKGDLAIIINDIPLKILSARIIRTMDTVSDGWTASIEWVYEKDNKQLYDALLPYKYPNAAVYIGGELIINGFISGIESTFSNQGAMKLLEGWSFTADLVDSTLKPPYEFNNITLEQHARDLIKYLGISVIFETRSDEVFSRITANSEDTLFSHLSKYAWQRRLLLSSTPTGNLLFTKSKTDGQPVGTIAETIPIASNYNIKFDGRKRFNTYRMIGQSPGENAKPAIALDNAVPKSRFKTFIADDTTKGDIQKVANWQRSKAIVDALTLPLPVTSWYAPDGTLWKENTLINVVNEYMHVPQGFLFLIRQVEYLYENEGKIANLYLIPPPAYTEEELKEDWR